MTPVLQLTAHGAIFSGTDRAVAALTDSFRRRHFVRLPGFVEPRLGREIFRGLSRTKSKRFQDSYGSESELEDDAAPTALLFLANDPTLFPVIRRMAGCGRIRSFAGRCYRLDPRHHDAMDWHDDLRFGRRVALTVNLSGRVYEGGVLQIRNRNSKKILEEIPNTGFGDAVLFRVASFLEHRVTPVVGRAPKMAFVGWFQMSPPSFFPGHMMARRLIANESLS